MKDIFLSAGVPNPNELPWASTADALLIHSAVRSLCTLTFGQKRIVWGGHPAITPMMWAACENLGVEYASSVRLYQSRFFPDTDFPAENVHFQNVTYCDALETRELSLDLMRRRMISSHDFEAGVFIGGKDGVEVEFELFRELCPRAKAAILPSTGGAAAALGERFPQFSAPSGDYIDFIGFLSGVIDLDSAPAQTSG
jgi:hypothetical protein